MRFAFAADYESDFTRRLCRGLQQEIESQGHEFLPRTPPEAIGGDVSVVFNVTDATAPRANYLRTRASNFICTIAETAEPSESLRGEAYRVLVKTMSNLLVYAVHGSAEAASYLVTPELGFRRVPHGPDQPRLIAEQVLGIADVRFVIDNELVEDLPPALHKGSEVTEAMARVGRALDGLDLLPSVLPLDEILSHRDRRLLMKVFGVKQLSYGNLSARHDQSSFWMTGRGVDKGNLREIGRDILLVRGFDAERLSMRLSVPPGSDPASRVSVDAIEHHVIYQAFPAVEAILHVHAWMPGIDSTLQNYPCGSWELAREVLALVRQQPDPTEAVVGLKNHGITVTGSGIESTFERVAGSLEQQVPMV